MEREYQRSPGMKELGRLGNDLRSLVEAVQTRSDKHVLLAIIEELKERWHGEDCQYASDLLWRVRYYFQRRSLVETVDPGVWESLWEFDHYKWWGGATEVFSTARYVAGILDAVAKGDKSSAVTACECLARLNREAAIYFLGRVYELMGEASEAQEHVARYGQPNDPWDVLWEYYIEMHGKPTDADEDTSLLDPGLKTRTLMYLVSSWGNAWKHKDWPGALRACRQMEEEMSAGDLADYLRSHLYEDLGDRAEAQASLRRSLETTRSSALATEVAERLRKLAG